VLKLYQFPISHYCEKARWALELKDLPYRKVNLMPGPHARKAKKIAGNSKLPILQHDKNSIQGSAEIITYLDKNFSRRSLTPEDPEEQKLAAAWESYADREIGPPVRLISYHTLLEHRDLVIPMMTQDGAWYSGIAMKAAYPKVSVAMRSLMKINNQSAEQARQQISTALDNIMETLADREFLVGDTFTRADLSVAALLAPLIMPQGYGLDWPEKMPEPLAGQIAGFQDRLGWVGHIYDNFR